MDEWLKQLLFVFVVIFYCLFVVIVCFRPERVHISSDIILYNGFTPNTDQTRPVFGRQRSKFTKVLHAHNL